jgi:hypothetical protein
VEELAEVLLKLVIVDVTFKNGKKLKSIKTNKVNQN